MKVKKKLNYNYWLLLKIVLTVPKTLAYLMHSLHAGFFGTQIRGSHPKVFHKSSSKTKSDEAICLSNDQ